MKFDRMADYTIRAGDIVRANYTFKKDKYEDLSFRKNENLKIINVAKDPNWAHAKNALGETGLIPLNYVQPTVPSPDDITSYSWFHGRITRLESESLLSCYPVGSFLVRDSDLFIGDLTLCVVGPPVALNGISDHLDQNVGGSSGTNDNNSTVKHYHIMRKHLKGSQSKQLLENSLCGNSTIGKLHYTLDEQDWFPTLLELIQFYSQPNRGLVCTLLIPVPDMQRKYLDKLTKSDLIINRQDLVLGDRIGKGEFAEVVKATYKNQQVAVKMYKNTASKLAITYEASLMTKLNHPNLVSFIGLVYEPDEALYLITEYLSNGSLLTYLHSRTRDEINDKTKLNFSIDVCRGLVYLEERELIHRDIAARNVLLSGQHPKLIAKIADFGMARDLKDFSTSGSLSDHVSSLQSDGSDRQSSLSPEPNSSPNQKVLHDNAAIPLKWTAPEAIRDRIFTSKSDVWSYGILLWEIYSYGRIPYPRMLANQVLRHIEAGYRMKSPEDCPSNIYALMNRTWQTNPNERPTFSEILSDLQRLSNQIIVENNVITFNSVSKSINIPMKEKSQTSFICVPNKFHNKTITNKKSLNPSDLAIKQSTSTTTAASLNWPIRKNNQKLFPKNLAELMNDTSDQMEKCEIGKHSSSRLSTNSNHPSMSLSLTLTNTNFKKSTNRPMAKTPDESYTLSKFSSS